MSSGDGKMVFVTNDPEITETELTEAPMNVHSPTEQPIADTRSNAESSQPPPPSSSINNPPTLNSSNNEAGLAQISSNFDALDSKGCWKWVTFGKIKRERADSAESLSNELGSQMVSESSPNGSIATSPSSVSLLTVGRDSEVYNMNNPKRGKAVIFNHENFNPSLGLDRRWGTEKDKQDLIQMLTKLGFDVTYHDDLTCDQVIREIEQLADTDHTAHDCLLITVLTHGEMNILYAKDYPYNSELIWASFNPDKVPSLAGKPKIFLIQACQGRELDHGTVLVKTSQTQVDSVPNYDRRVPADPDFLIVNSTFPGHFSWRNKINGTWFVQTLCKVFQQFAKQKDLLAMMIHVSREVALKYESNTLMTAPELHQKKEIPVVTSTLIRDLYLIPKS